MAVSLALRLKEVLGDWLVSRFRLARRQTYYGIGNVNQRIGNPVNRAAKMQNQTRVEAVFGLASLECRDRAVSQGYVSAAPQALLAGRTVPGVEGQVSMVAIGALRMHRRGNRDRGFSGTA